MYKYYLDEENCILYKSGYEGSLEEYIGDCLWNAVWYEELIDGLVEIDAEEADDLIKEFEGDDFKLVDGNVLDTYREDI